MIITVNINKNKKHIFSICSVLVLITLISFEQVRQNDFVDFDDNYYVTANPRVTSGLTWESVKWAFELPLEASKTAEHASNWHPLTWLSHILDCELFGLNAGRHHLSSLLFHIINTLLLFLVLQRMTGVLWPSGLAAGLFAVHPLHVESVAWIAERKDILSGFFWMLTIAAYLHYADRPSVIRILLVIVLFGLGLLAKPMLVTLPLVLLLLDYWPLKRLSSLSPNTKKISPRLKLSRNFKRGWRKDRRNSPISLLIWEKVPLFILAAASCAITYIVQQKSGAVKSWEILPLSVRLANALVSYVSYIVKMIYPSRLAVLYPHPQKSLLSWRPMVCLLILALITAAVIYLARRRRYLLVGWLWYLGTLIPVIGLVQVGVQAMADRYTYLPSIGIFIMAAWGAAELAGPQRYRQGGVIIIASVWLMTLLIGARLQVSRWQNSITLFEHCLAVTENNYNIHNDYGSYLCKIGRLNQGIEQLNECLRLNSRHPRAHFNLGQALAERNDNQQAIFHLSEAVKINPDYARALDKLGTLLMQQGDLANAAIRFAQLIRLNPQNDHAHYKRGRALLMTGDAAGAIKHFQKALKINPDRSDTLNDLSWILATHKDAHLRDGPEAVRLAQQACALTDYQIPEMLGTLAAAYAEADRFPEAIEAAQKAIDLYQAFGRAESAAQAAQQLQLYQQQKPYRDKL